MKTPQIIAGVAAVAAILSTSKVSAQIPYPFSGIPNPVTYSFTAQNTGDIMAYFAGSTASYEETLGMLDNGVLASGGFGLDDHSSSLGQSFDLGHVNAGDKLTFVVDVISL